MAETETPHTETNQPEQELISAEELAKFNGWAAEGIDSDTAARAQKLVEIDNTLVGDEALAYAPQVEASQEATEEVAQPANPVRQEATAPSRQETSPRVKRNRAIAGVAGITLASGAAMGVALNEALKEPEFSRETTTHTLEENEGLWHAAKKIKGVEEIDMRDAMHFIEVDPANTEVLKEGLMPGEVLVIPVSVVGHENDE